MTSVPTHSADDVAFPALPPGKEWPAYMLGDGRVKAMLRETYARIAHATAADQALAAERDAALERCRADVRERMRLARLAFAVEVSAIDDAQLSELTGDEIDSIIDGVLKAAALSPPAVSDVGQIVERFRAAEKLEGVDLYPDEWLARALRGSVVDALICEAEPHVIADAIGIAVQSANLIERLSSSVEDGGRGNA